MRRDGIENLCIITDFDRTLTSHRNPKGMINTTFQMIQELDLLGPEYSRTTKELFDQYRPIEKSHMDYDEKTKKMTEWWALVLQAMTRYEINEENLTTVSTELTLRAGARELIEKTKELDIPLIVFSAGLGDVIKKILPKHAQIISNYLRFDTNGQASGYDREIIHALNKNGLLLKERYPTSLRKNIILLGDSTEDARMSDGIEYRCAIKIGFPDEGCDPEKYLQTYDLIVPDDGPMHRVTEILEKIARN